MSTLVVVLFAAMLLVVMQVFSKPTPTGTAAPIDGIECGGEVTTTHFHAHLALLSNGNPIDVPSQIGIKQPQDGNCLYWLHTHGTDGVIHIETPGRTDFTLGNFFDVWGKPLAADKVADLQGTLHAFVNGTAWTGDLRSIPLAAHNVIVIEVGKEVPPPPYTFAASE